ncbi:Oidioi.mRNA.OKI2018_I69.chr2.g5209.t1.cds [Oikopleura dioica]|uniref:Oidioi.mRNA.OKI2018_I69.chr2.g5209.t1.cds n=1 Tax=Oikopleura dioica TaxID=34765 RepID=A0ABN7T695_OIKDI|nr:Oidioi.mRNA.OKI2018_I69.chr2.g5209.t1.cds [Oikopleura dioica]
MNDSWSQIGSLKEGDASHSSIKINNSIFIISGEEYPLQRVEIEGDEVKNSEIIGRHSSYEAHPVLLQVPVGFCV